MCVHDAVHCATFLSGDLYANMKDIECQPIKTLQDVIGCLSSVMDHNTQHANIWFRGETEHEKLMPKIFRHSGYEEVNLMADIERKHNDLQGLRPDTSFLCIAEALNIPTRMLAWSKNILVALYFAVSAPHTHREDEKTDRYLYILDAVALNNISGMEGERNRLYEPDDYDTHFRSTMAFAKNKDDWLGLIRKNNETWRWEEYEAIIKKRFENEPTRLNTYLENYAAFFYSPLAVNIPWTTARARSQSLMFTLHGGWTSEHSNFPQDAHILQQLPIPAACVKQIRRQLAQIDIHSGTVFPGSDQQYQYLTDLWKKNRDTS